MNNFEIKSFFVPPPHHLINYAKQKYFSFYFPMWEIEWNDEDEMKVGVGVGAKINSSCFNSFLFSVVLECIKIKMSF